MSYIAVDIGATNIRVAMGNSNGIEERKEEFTDKNNGANGVAAQIIRMIEELVVKPKAIGIGSIGPIDLKRGIIKNTPNYPFSQIPIVEPLRKQFGVPTILVNDCSAAVQGERVFGAGMGLNNLFYVTLSTGIGGGAIVDGHLLSGKDGNAPEIGHITVCHNSELICGCGGKGHWEAYAGGKNIPSFARVLISRMNWESSLLYERCDGKLSNIETETIFDLSKQRDQLSINIVEEIGKINAAGFSNIVNTFDPELITLGGSVALNNPSLILNPILKGIDQYIINRKPEIIITPLGGDAVLTGALALSIRAVFNTNE